MIVGAGTAKKPSRSACAPVVAREVRLISQGEASRPSVSGESHSAVTGSMNTVAAKRRPSAMCSLRSGSTSRTPMRRASRSCVLQCTGMPSARPNSALTCMTMVTGASRIASGTSSATERSTPPQPPKARRR
ncbi:conserved hypothetical protein, partial [Ricinus communis]